MITIQRVLVKYGLDDVIKQTHLFRPLRFLFYLAPRRRDKSAPLGERIRLALEELGPIFVKFGQALSTRRDLLPPDIADELAKLQDAVPPFPAEAAVAIIESAYGESVDTVFERFDKEPLAAASIAQVHTAKLATGHEVIVKVLRPGVQDQIESDLAVLRVLAGLADRYWEHGKRLRPLEIVDEYEHTILDELDLMREAGNAAQLKRNFQGSDMLYVPEPGQRHHADNNPAAGTGSRHPGHVLCSGFKGIQKLGTGSIEKKPMGLLQISQIRRFPFGLTIALLFGKKTGGPKIVVADGKQYPG